MENKLLIQDLAEAIAIKEGITKKKSEAFIKALFETIEEGLISDKFIKIKGLGTFKIISVGERESVNINTGERFSIEGHDKISFTPDTLLKDLINRPFAHFQTVIINDETDIEELEKVDEDTADIQVPEASETTTEEESEDTELSESEEGTIAEPTAEAEIVSENGTEAKTNEQIRPETETGTATLAAPERNVETPVAESSTNSEAQPTITVSLSPLPIPEADAAPQETETATVGSDTESPSEHHEPAITEDKENTPDAEHQFDDDRESDPTPKGTQIFEKSEESEATAGSPIKEGTNQSSQNPVNSSFTAENDTFTEDESEGATETQEVKPEQIQYIIKELEGKRNIWKTTAMILLAILLLMLSYFAGYFRWFCPCELMRNAQGEQNTTMTADEKASCAALADSVPASDSIAVVSQTQDKDTIATKMNEEKPQTVTNPGTVTVAPPKKQLPPAPVKRPEMNYRQLEGGKYKIVGTIGKHEIIGGETIRTIALDVYGSKGYAPYIIVHNNIEDPDNVECGTIIQLPKLERKNK